LRKQFCQFGSGLNVLHEVAYRVGDAFCDAVSSKSLRRTGRADPMKEDWSIVQPEIIIAGILTDGSTQASLQTSGDSTEVSSLVKDWSKR